MVLTVDANVQLAQDAPPHAGVTTSRSSASVRITPYFIGQVSSLAPTGYQFARLATSLEEAYDVAARQTLESALQLPLIESTGSSERPMQSHAELREFRIPPLKFPAIAHPVLTVKIRKLLQTLGAIVVSRAAQLNFPLRETVVSIFSDPTEGESKAVLSLICRANISQALAFWDSLEPDFQNWLETLNENEKSNFLNKISMRVYWQ